MKLFRKEKPKKNFFLRLVEWKIKILDFFSPLSLVGLRIYVGLIFWKSGLTKFDKFDNAILLFRDEYMTADKITFFGSKFLTARDIAFVSTFSELTFSILLILGLGGRLAAAALLIMTAVIQFTYVSSPEHLVWTLMLLPILMMGAGRASWDFFIKSTVLETTVPGAIKEKLFAILCTLCLTLYAAYLIFTDIVQMH